MQCTLPFERILRERSDMPQLILALPRKEENTNEIKVLDRGFLADQTIRFIGLKCLSG